MEKFPVKVFYDNCIFLIQKIGGISIVFSEILRHLKKDGNLSISILLNGDASKNLVFNETISGLKLFREFGINKTFLPFMPILKRFPEQAIFHSTFNRYSLQKNIIKVITIHDLGYEYGVMRSGVRRSVHLFFKRRAISGANAIICVSESTKKDLLNYYNGLLDKKIIKVIYNGLDDDFLNINTSQFDYNESQYILYVGARHAYKNFDQVVKAVSKTKDFKLVICGGGKLTMDESNLLENLLATRYNFHDNIEKRRLINFYLYAHCLIYPSAYEGFGLPVLEAMACGCPVIACNNSSIPEIAGGAAILLNDANSENIKNIILKLKNKKLRHSLMEMGKVNAQRFSWEKAAWETSDLYKQLIR